ncbi:MAG: histidine phosphatase family protein [Coriobacteriia bacterium]|nr:histidine phosphatase family protein [Coriobacteriia bacterium]
MVLQEKGLDLVLVRHGQTQGNLDRCYNGSTDQPLCAEGVATCRARGEDHSVVKVHVSPLLRARQTAKLCFPAAEQVVVDDLRETDFGAFEGKSYEQLKDDPEYIAWIEGNCEAPCPGGESRAQACERTIRAFRELVESAVTVGDDRVVIVAHGGTIMALMERFAVERRPFHEWRVPNCSGYRGRVVLDSSDEIAIRDYEPW